MVFLVIRMQKIFIDTPVIYRITTTLRHEILHSILLIILPRVFIKVFFWVLIQIFIGVLLGILLLKPSAILAFPSKGIGPVVLPNFSRGLLSLASPSKSDLTMGLRH